MTNICVQDGCERPVKVFARGLCNAHYIRAQRSGSLAPLDRFAENVAISDRCWEWQGRKEKGGYGRWGGGLAHRVAWERTVGPIPDDMTIDHLCHNPGCVNVAHLRLLSPSENYSDNTWRDRENCSRGHAYTDENTRIRMRYGRKHRVCRACDRERQAESVARRASSPSPDAP